MTAANDQPTGIVGGRPWPRPAPTWRQPSYWYYVNLGVAMIGMSSLAVGLGSEIRMRMGLPGGDALDHEGLWMFVVSLSWGYWFRLIFWGRVPPRYQNIVRTTLSAFVATELPLAAITGFLVITQGSIQLPDDPAYSVAPVLTTVYTVIGTLCQISTVIWLLRYRKE